MLSRCRYQECLDVFSPGTSIGSMLSKTPQLHCLVMGGTWRGLESIALNYEFPTDLPVDSSVQYQPVVPSKELALLDLCRREWKEEIILAVN